MSLDEASTAPRNASRSASATWSGDLLGGFTAAIVLLAIEGSYGLVAFAPLGSAAASQAFLLGVYAAAIGSAVSMLAGGRGPLLTGSSAALALLTPPLLMALMADPRLQAAGVANRVPLLFGLAGLGVAIAGILQLLVGALRLGALVRYVPYPVHAGFMNGVAVLMVLAMLPHLLGVAPRDPAPWAHLQPLALLVALASLAVALRPPRWTRAVPSYLVALAFGTALHHGLAAAGGADRLGPLFGPLAFDWPQWLALEPLRADLPLAAWRALLPLLLQFAFAVALISCVQTLLASSVVDAHTRRRRNGDRELFAQGAANVAVGLVGALAGAGAVTRSKLNLNAGGRTRRSRLSFAVGLVLALAVGTQVLRHVPMAAIAGVFVSVAFTLVDPWSRRATVTLLRHLARLRPPPPSLRASVGVMLLVAATSVFASLMVGVALGILVAMLMFIRSHTRDPVRQVSYADLRASLKMRPAPLVALLREHGRRIALVELDGALFFGTADAAAREIDRVMHEAEQVVIDFQRVSEIDASGARVLLQAADELRRQGKQLLLASLPPADPRRRIVREMDLHGQLDDSCFFPDADRALERAEDLLLARLQPSAQRHRELGLGDTMLGQGLSAQELQTLRSYMVERRVAGGEHVFRRGDTSPSLFVALQGEIGIWLPDEADPPRVGRRLVSFAPGVVFGEIGLLEDRPRSADAIAAEDAVLYELSKPSFEQFAAGQPALVAKLLRNLSLHLSARVRALTDELKASQARH